VLLQGFQSIRPFPVGNLTVGRAMATVYLQSYGLPNAGLAPVAQAVVDSPELLGRLMLWSQASGSYAELVDFLLDRLLIAYRQATNRWLGRPEAGGQLDEIALRLLSRARRSPGWFSAQDAVRWVGRSGGPTVLRHLNHLVRRGFLESLGRTRAKRYRLVSPASVIPVLLRQFGGPKYVPAAARTSVPDLAELEPRGRSR
jgi:Fic family protein